MSVPSPCVRNCCLDHRDVCVGCHRSLDEIRRWSVADDDERRRIVDRALARRLEDAASTPISPWISRSGGAP